MIDKSFFESLVIPRPVGSSNNTKILNKLKDTAELMGYETEMLPFSCKSWVKGDSFASIGETRLIVNASPFSPEFHGKGELVRVENIEELKSFKIEGKIVLLHGKISSEQLMPKNFPFYYPDEHDEIYRLLETGNPLAVLCATGKHPMCGLDPCAMFEDCNFNVPSAYFSLHDLHLFNDISEIELCIESGTNDENSFQLIIRKNAENITSKKLVFCAHMDTAYNTPGALDNASGLAVLLQIMEKLSDLESSYNFEFLPFNGEDYCELSGQMAYLDKYPIKPDECRLVINTDDAGHVDSLNAISTHNIDAECELAIEKTLSAFERTARGPVWYESDHTMYAQQGVQCIVFAASNLLETTIKLTHTPEDTVDKVDFTLLEEISDFTVCLLKELNLVR